jgi:hypothetical protein
MGGRATFAVHPHRRASDNFVINAVMHNIKRMRDVARSVDT